MNAARFIVVGKVQGVWFRAATRDQAVALGLHGHAINLPDGCVEVVATGDPVALDQLHDWLRRGPPLARVDHIERANLTLDDALHAGFTIG